MKIITLFFYPTNSSNFNKYLKKYDYLFNILWRKKKKKKIFK